MEILALGIDSTGAVKGAQTWSAATKQVVASSATMASGVQAADAALGRLGNTFRTLKGTLGGLLLGYGIYRGIRDAIDNIVTFEQTMQTVRGVTRATTQDFALMTEEARKMGFTTRYTATQAAEGLLILSKAGFSAQESSEALQSVLNLAITATISMGEAANITANILRQFGLEASQAERVTNVLVTTSNSSNTNIEQLGQAMSFAGTLAAGFAESVESVSAALGVMADRGVKGMRGGTALRQIFVQLSKPTEDVQKLLRALNLTLRDVNPQAHSLVEIFEKLKGTGASTQELLKLFDVRTAPGAQALFGGLDKWKELEKLNIDLKDSAKKLAEVMDDSLYGAFRKMVSALQEVELQIGERGLVKSLRLVIDYTADVLRVFAGADDSMLKFGESSRTVANGLKLLGEAIAVIIAYKFTVFLLETVSAIWQVVASVRALGALLITNPFSIMAASIVVVATLMYELRNTMVTVGGQTMEFRDTQRGMLRTLKVYWQAAAEEVERYNIAFEKSLHQARSATQRPGFWNLAARATVKLTSPFVPLIGNAYGDTMEILAEQSAAAQQDREWKEKFDISEKTKHDRWRAEFEKMRELMQAATEQSYGTSEFPKEQDRRITYLQQLKDEQQALADEARALHFVGAARAVEIRKIELEKQARDGTTLSIQNQSEALLRDIRVMDTLRNLRSVADGIGQSFADAFLDMATGAQNAAEAIRQLATQILRLVLNQTIAQPIAGVISNSIYSVGAGVVGAINPNFGRQPGYTGAYPSYTVGTQFGNISTLPVSAAGGGSAKVVNVTQNISTPNSDSFRRSSRQIMGEITRY